MKKTISAIVASVMAVSAMTAVSASAINLEEENVLSVSTEAVASTMTIDGTEVPAGAVAITVNIDNNNGFVSTMTKLNIGEADVVVDLNGKPVVETSNLLGESLITGAENEGLIAFSTASANVCSLSGEMFTFYVENYNSVNIIESEMFSSVSTYNDGISTASSNNYYITGDVDGNYIVNASDASKVLNVLDTYNRDRLTYSMVKLIPQMYFPDAISFKAAFIWNLGDDFNESTANDTNIIPISQDTADEILEYYTCSRVGASYEGSYLGLPGLV